VSGLRERDESAIAGAPEPEVFAKPLCVPVGARGGDHDHAPVGRERDTTEINGVEEFVEGETRFGVGGGCDACKEQEDESEAENGAFRGSHGHGTLGTVVKIINAPKKWTVAGG